MEKSPLAPMDCIDKGFLRYGIIFEEDTEIVVKIIGKLMHIFDFFEIYFYL